MPRWRSFSRTLPVWLAAFPHSKTSSTTEGEFSGVSERGQGALQLARVLQYLECPQYLRRHLFPIHRDLQFAGLLNPLDCPHHLRASEECPYREGVVARLPVKEGSGSFVNCGLEKEVWRRSF